MRREWDLDELIDSWTVVEADRELIGNKHGPTRLGFALLLKFFEIEARFPRHAREIPPAAVGFVARQVGVDPGELAGYDFSGRSIKEHRRQIRDHLGFRVFTRGDEDKMIAWLAGEVCPSELNEDRQREAVLARCRAEKLEPPGRIDRIIGQANAAADRQFCATTVSRLAPAVIEALDAVLTGPDGADGADGAGSADGSVAVGALSAVESGGATFFAELKADPGQLGLETLLAEITKLKRVRAIGLPDGLFAGVADKRVARWRARAVAEYPSTLRRDHPRDVSLTLLAVLCWCRLTEVTDSLVELFIQLVHRINARAERRVDREEQAEFRRVANKEGVLFRLAGAAIEHPEDTVRAALYPVVSEGTLRDLVAEAKATETRRRARVRTVLTGSYSHHYRVMLPKLLDALEFRCNNTAYRPVMDAVELLHRYKDRDGRVANWFASTWGDRSAKTFNTRLTALGSACAYWRKQDWLSGDPLVRLRTRPVPPDNSRALTRPQVESVHGLQVPLRERVFWTLLYESAARADEVLLLDVPDLDTANRRAVVTRKGGAKDVIVWQTGSARLLPRLLAGRRAGPVFLTDRRARPSVALVDVDPVTGRARLSYRRAAELFEQHTASLPGGPFTLHQLRHSGLTHAAEAGASTPMLMALSGHTSVRSLTKYTRISAEALAKWQAERDPAGRRASARRGDARR